MSTLKLFKKDFYERIGGLRQFKDLNVLDLGCGDGEDAFEIAKFAKKVVGVDIIKNPLWKKRNKTNLSFKISKAEKLPFKANTFNGLFLKDVIHHVDNIEKTLKEIRRVTTRDAFIILVEGNRYNPLFYIHMTKMRGHEHLTQKEFITSIRDRFINVDFKFIECHYVPFINPYLFTKMLDIEKFLEKFFFLKPFLSYNVAIINKQFIKNR